MRIRLPFLGYFIFGLFLFYLFLLWQFPSTQTKRAMVEAFEETFPLTLSIGQVRPSFPVSLRLENIRISSASLSFQVPDLILTPHLHGFLIGETDLAIGDSKNSSRLLARFRQEKRKNYLSLRLNQAEIQASSPKKGFSFLLRLSGEGSMQWEGEDVEKGNGQVWALLERSEVQGAQISEAPLLLTLFHTLRTEGQLKEGIIRVKRLEASGKETRFSLPKDFQFPIRGGNPLDWASLFHLPSQKE